MGMLKKRLVYREDVYNALEAARVNSICGILTDRYKDGFHDGIKKAEEIIANDIEDAPSAQEWISFAHWVASEVIDEKNWDLNCISFPEIACRKLNKLGIIDTDGRRWIYTPPKEE